MPIDKKPERKPLRGVLPTLREERLIKSIRRKIFDINIDRRRSEKKAIMWHYRGQEHGTEFIGEFKSFGIDLIANAKEHIIKNGKIKIVELGMGYGNHVPEIIKQIQQTISTPNIEYHDLSLSRHYSNLNPELLELEKKGIVKRHIGIFEVRPVEKLKDAQIIIERFGPVYHSIYTHESVMKLLNLAAPQSDIYIIANMDYLSSNPLTLSEIRRQGFTIDLLDNGSLFMTHLKRR